MTPSEARNAKLEGINKTAHEWIAKIETAWERELGSGRDYLRVNSLEDEVQEVQDIVVDYFVRLGYGFQMETFRGVWDDYETYCLRIQPVVVEKQPGILSRLFSRLLGGSYAGQ